MIHPFHCPQCHRSLLQPAQQRLAGWCDTCGWRGLSVHELALALPANASKLASLFAYQGALWLSGQGVLHRFDLTGQNWQSLPLPGAWPVRGLAFAAGTVIVSPGEASTLGQPKPLLGMDAQTGALRWQLPGQGIEWSAPAADEQLVCAVDSLGRVAAVHPADGSAVLSLPGLGNFSRRGIGPCLTARLVLLVSPEKDGGILHAFDRQTGECVWDFQPETGGVDCPPATDEQNAFVCAGDTLYAVSLRSGKGQVIFKAPRKSHEGWFFGAPVITAKGLLLRYADYDQDRRAYALSLVAPQNGNIIWRRVLTSHPKLAPVCVGNRIYFADRQGQIVMLDLSSGDELTAAFSLGDDRPVSAPVVLDEDLFLHTAAGQVLHYTSYLTLEHFPQTAETYLQGGDWQRAAMVHVLHGNLAAARTIYQAHQCEDAVHGLDDLIAEAEPPQDAKLIYTTGDVSQTETRPPNPALEMAQRALDILERQVAGYGSLSVPVHLQIQLEDKRREVVLLHGATAKKLPSYGKLSLDERHPLKEEKIRLDVAYPERVEVERTFQIAVRVSQPDSLPLNEKDLARVASRPGRIFRIDDDEVIRYRVGIQAPDCEPQTDEQIFLLRPQEDSEVIFFLLTAKRGGSIPIRITAYQENDQVAAQTLIQVTAEVFAQSSQALQGSLQQKKTTQEVHMSENEYEDAVFVSYAWGEDRERPVDELEQAFFERGIRIVRDKKDLGYRGSIEEFEKRIGRGQCIVLVISDKYLRSKHCMYELVEIDQNRDARGRIFPIVLPDAKIYNSLDRLDYIQYWDGQIKVLNKKIKQVHEITGLESIIADLKKYKLIRDNFDQLTGQISDMNTLTPEIHAKSGYATLVAAVQQVLAPNLPVSGTSNTTPAITTSPTAWTLQQKGTVVNALLACPSISNHQTRDNIVNELPPNIRNAISRSEANRPDVTNILITCLNYNGGLQKLVEAIEFFDRDAIPVQQLKQTLIGMGAL
jgi:outer membrane protein assembly factor BamB